jgi:hypothetical protein
MNGEPVNPQLIHDVNRTHLDDLQRRAAEIRQARDVANRATRRRLTLRLPHGLALQALRPAPRETRR